MMTALSCGQNGIVWSLFTFQSSGRLYKNVFHDLRGESQNRGDLARVSESIVAQYFAFRHQSIHTGLHSARLANRGSMSATVALMRSDCCCEGTQLAPSIAETSRGDTGTGASASSPKVCPQFSQSMVTIISW